MSNENVSLNTNQDEENIVMVPMLSELYESGYIKRIKDAYFDYKSKNKVNNLKDVCEEEKIICIAYYSLSVILGTVPNLDIRDVIMYNNKKYDEDVLVDFIDNSITQFEKDSYIYSPDPKNNFDMKYKEYYIGITRELTHKNDVEQFMKKVYIPSVKKSIKKYFLGGRRLDLEKIFPGITDEEVMDEAEYYIYYCLYKIYMKYYKGMFKLAKFKMEFKHMDLNQATYFIVSKLEELNCDLFTKEEYFDVVSIATDNVKDTIRFSKEQYNKLKDEGYFNERTKKNN